jgi:hypothetical protein
MIILIINTAFGGEAGCLVASSSRRDSTNQSGRPPLRILVKEFIYLTFLDTAEKYSEARSDLLLGWRSSRCPGGSEE